jgi:hypothetical protein
VPILPGHLGILDPSSLNLPLLYRLFDDAYRTRNQSVAYRRGVMLRTVLFSPRPPRRTLRIVGSGLRLARELRAGRLRLVELEQLVGRIFLCEHAAGIRYPILDMIRLAEDIDTEEEARAIHGEIEPPGAG